MDSNQPNHTINQHVATKNSTNNKHKKKQNNWGAYFDEALGDLLHNRLIYYLILFLLCFFHHFVKFRILFFV